MASLEQLLVLQEHDTAADQLEHRRSTLPERTELEQLRREVGSIEAEQETTQADRDEVARAQKRLEDEVATVEDRAATVHQTLYGGTVTSPRELQALQDDEAALKRHQSAIEDKVIEQMELAVPLDERLSALDDRHGELGRQIDDVAAKLASAEVAIDDELAAIRAARDGVAASVAPDLLERYETLRHDLGGIAVARLVGTNCGGCHLTLSAVELDRIRHEPGDAIVLCEECGRLLVH
jgi:predicted  nucleic acid-binding Zn-ribbon protein